MIRFFVPGIPKTKGSVRAMVNPKTSKPFVMRDCKKSKSWEQLVHGAAMDHFDKPLKGPVALVLDWTLPAPRTIPIDRLGHPAAKPDGDKLERCVWDALTGVAYVDDSQVVRWGGSKVYGDKPGVDITVMRVPCTHGRLRRTKKWNRCRHCGVTWTKEAGMDAAEEQVRLALGVE